MNRERNLVSAGACLIAGALGVMLLTPGAAVAAGDVQDPCAGFGMVPPPPSVYFDPKCFGDTEAKEFDVDPMMKGDSVNVEWEYNGTVGQSESNVRFYHIYRGPSPFTMKHVGLVDAHQENSFEDDRALTGQADTWYRVVAIHHDGENEASAAHLIQPYPRQMVASK